jgi:hypothetical protein
MSRPALIEIDGKLFLWRDLLARRREQVRSAATASQPTLFEVRRDHRPVAERTGAGRYLEPTLFTSSLTSSCYSPVVHNTTTAQQANGGKP